MKISSSPAEQLRQMVTTYDLESFHDSNHLETYCLESRWDTYKLEIALPNLYVKTLNSCND